MTAQAHPASHLPHSGASASESGLEVSGPELAALRRAIELAGQGAGTALPNPVVGCVLLAPGGWTVGEGFHERPGSPHAEINALNAAGRWAQGATAVVTLEPCNHTGRTGPCSAALVAAGVRRVLVAVQDPWLTAAGGIGHLRSAGVEVVDLSDTMDPEVSELVTAAEDVNRIWLTATRLERPFVTWKAGMTIDGRVAAADGTSRWITSEQSRADVHALRSRVDTMMVGIGTVLADDPQLTVRDADGIVTGPQPLRVVIDSTGRTPSTARVLDNAAETVLGTVEQFGSDGNGRVDLAAVLSLLYQRGQRHILLEGGPRLAAAFLDAGLVDEVLVYLAPTLLGAGRVGLEGGSVHTLADAHRARLMDVTHIGPDVRLRYTVNRKE